MRGLCAICAEEEGAQAGHSGRGRLAPGVAIFFITNMNVSECLCVSMNVYYCLLLSIIVYSRSLLHIIVYYCLLLFIIVYYCLLLFIIGYYCLLLFIIVYYCLYRRRRRRGSSCASKFSKAQSRGTLLNSKTIITNNKQ